MELMDLFDDDFTACVTRTSLFPAHHPFYKAEMNITMVTNRSIDIRTIGLKVTFDHEVECSEKRVTIYFCDSFEVLHISLQNNLVRLIFWGKIHLQNLYYKLFHISWRTTEVFVQLNINHTDVSNHSCLWVISPFGHWFNGVSTQNRRKGSFKWCTIFNLFKLWNCCNHCPWCT